MSGLQTSYSKEVARELNLIPVCPPGRPVAVGDIITFPYGRGGLFGGSPRPWGSFEKVSDLASLGVEVRLSPLDDKPDTYIYASRREVGINFTANAAASTGPAGAAPVSGTIGVSFHKEGTVYLAAVECGIQRLEQLEQVRVDLVQHAQDILWHDTFLVVSVTTAKKALVMQSTSSQGSFEAGGDVKGLVPGSGPGQISAAARIEIKSMRDASFIKPWSDDVTMFFGLMRFEKQRFGRAAETHALLLAGAAAAEFQLAPVNPADLVESVEW